MSLILCLSGISMGPYCRKSLAKRGDGDWKKYKKGTWPYRGGSIEGGGSNLLPTMLELYYVCQQNKCLHILVISSSSNFVIEKPI